MKTDRMIEQRPTSQPEARLSSGSLPRALLDQRPGAAVQRRLLESIEQGAGKGALVQLRADLNAGPTVTRLGRLGAMLNPGSDAVAQAAPAAVTTGTGVVQAMMEDDAAAPVAQQPAPEFSLANLLFSSHAGGEAGAAERSLYFASGRRIRLVHDAAPHVGGGGMERYSFRPKAGGGHYDEDDYDRIVQGQGDQNAIRQALDVILKPAAAGDTGTLFEIAAGRYGDRHARTHASRGGAVNEDGIASQQQLDQIVQIAIAADHVVPALETAYEDAEQAYDHAYDALDAAKRALDLATAAYDQADQAYAAMTNLHRRTARVDWTEQNDTDYQNALEALREAEEARDQAAENCDAARNARDEAREVRNAARDEFEQRVEEFNAQMAQAYAPAAQED